MKCTAIPFHSHHFVRAHYVACFSTRENQAVMAMFQTRYMFPDDRFDPVCKLHLFTHDSYEEEREWHQKARHTRRQENFAYSKGAFAD